MSICCICFGKNKKNKVENDNTSIKKTSSEHYQALLKEYDYKSTNSVDTSKQSLEMCHESPDDYPINHIILPQKNSLSPNISNLYHPCKEAFQSCSELVLSKFSSFDVLSELEQSND